MWSLTNVNLKVNFPLKTRISLVQYRHWRRAYFLDPKSHRSVKAIQCASDGHLHYQFSEWLTKENVHTHANCFNIWESKQVLWRLKIKGGSISEQSLAQGNKACERPSDTWMMCDQVWNASHSNLEKALFLVWYLLSERHKWLPERDTLYTVATAVSTF